MQQNDTTLIYIGLAALSAVSFVALGYFIRKIHAKGKVKSAEDKAVKMVEAAKIEAVKIQHQAELEAKNLLLKTIMLLE